MDYISVILLSIAPLGYPLIGLFAHCQLLSSRKRNCQTGIYIEEVLTLPKGVIQEHQSRNYKYR